MFKEKSKLDNNNLEYFRNPMYKHYEPSPPQKAPIKPWQTSALGEAYDDAKKKLSASPRPRFSLGQPKEEGLTPGSPEPAKEQNSGFRGKDLILEGRLRRLFLFMSVGSM
jgi:hypothetical protein